MFKKPKDSALQNALASKRIAEQAKIANRNRLCVPPKYQGKPEDYTYVAAEYCRLKKKVAAAEKKATISAQQNRSEIKAIDKILKVLYSSNDRVSYLDGNDVFAMVYVFQQMTDDKLRIKYPQPADRFKDITSNMSKSKRFDVFTPGRFYIPVLEMLQIHLQKCV